MAGCAGRRLVLRLAPHRTSDAQTRSKSPPQTAQAATRYWLAGDQCNFAPNILDRQFYATQPNRKWIADFTYIWTAEGWLYVAAVIDLFSRRVVGLLSVIALQSPVGQRVDERHNDGPNGDGCSSHGDLAAWQTRRTSPSLRPRQSVYV